MDNEIKHSLTYAHLFRHATDNSSIPLCLSEFIDNSISSYINDSKNIEIKAKKISGCIIDIIIDETDINNFKLIIKDNAKGMDKDTLIDAVQEYKNTYSSDRTNAMNQYGIGMKFAIFFLGKNGKIWTKRKDGEEIFVDYMADKKNANDPVKTTPSSPTHYMLNDETQGTYIEISDVYSSQKKSTRITEKELEKISQFLSYRYIEYFKNGLIINFKTKTLDGLFEEKLRIDCHFIEKFDILEKNIFKINHFIIKKCGLSENNKAEIIENRKSIIKSVKEINSCDEILKKSIIEKLELNEKLKFKETITFDDKEINFDLYILDEPSSNNAGIAILHNKRYIKHPPKHASFDGSEPFFYDAKQLEGKWKWFYGVIDITDYADIIRPDKNKSSLIKNTNISDEWDNKFKDIIKKYIPFINVFINFTQNTKKILDKNIKKNVEDYNKENNCIASFNEEDASVTLDCATDQHIQKIFKKFTIDNVKFTFVNSNEIENAIECEKREDDSFLVYYKTTHPIFKNTSNIYVLKLISLLHIIVDHNHKINDSLLGIINELIGK